MMMMMITRALGEHRPFTQTNPVGVENFLGRDTAHRNLKKIFRWKWCILVHFTYALFMTSEGLMVTQHEPIKTTKKCLCKNISYIYILLINLLGS